MVFNPGPERILRSAANRFTFGARAWFRNAGTFRPERSYKSKVFSPLAEMAPLSNYWKYNSKAVKRCRRKFSPTATDLDAYRPTWSMRPFDLPLGFKYATAYAGIRKQEKDDLALIVSGVPAAAAAVFTTNRVQAAPVKLARANMRASKGVCGAILVNAGNANCATKTEIKSPPTRRRRWRSC